MARKVLAEKLSKQLRWQTQQCNVIEKEGHHEMPNKEYSVTRI